jgi:phosphoserine phosphatase
MRLALFDLDNTLLAGDSDFEWAQYLIEQGVLDREVYEARNQHFYNQYKAGTLDIHEFLDFQLKPLSRHPRAQLDAWHRDFMARKILPIVAPGTAELLGRHADHVQVIVTATNSFVTGPIAAHLGVPHLIATEPERVGDGFTGRPFGTPSFREGKITRLEQWEAQQG